jgi:predicted signal transduction protein with EAL and GGDEF domain
LGHPIGDALLRAVTQRVRGQVREIDTVARLGGDEFAIVQSNLRLPTDAAAQAERLIEAVGAPYEIEGNLVTIGTSIGIATLPGDGLHPDMLLKNAEVALYRAKADGRGRFCFFKPEMESIVQTRRVLELDLRKALVEAEFRVFYQPLVNLATDRVCGFEALLRWFHPQRGLIPPADFIGLAEEVGLIVPLGRWVLHQACCDAAAWATAIDRRRRYSSASTASSGRAK